MFKKDFFIEGVEGLMSTYLKVMLGGVPFEEKV